MKNILFTSLMAVACTVSAQAPDFSQKFIRVTVKAVHDGDSYKVEFPGGKNEWVRLVGVDAPEVLSPYIVKAQPFGRNAGDSVRILLKGTTVFLDTLATKNSRDQYGRLLGEIYTQDSVFLPLLLVERGWAWAAPQKNRTAKNLNRTLQEAQKEAKENGMGLFATRQRAVRPDTWRERYGRN